MRKSLDRSNHKLDREVSHGVPFFERQWSSCWLPGCEMCERMIDAAAWMLWFGTKHVQLFWPKEPQKVDAGFPTMQGTKLSHYEMHILSAVSSMDWHGQQGNFTCGRYKVKSLLLLLFFSRSSIPCSVSQTSLKLRDPFVRNVTRLQPQVVAGNIKSWHRACHQGLPTTW